MRTSHFCFSVLCVIVPRPSYKHTPVNIECFVAAALSRHSRWLWMTSTFPWNVLFVVREFKHWTEIAMKETSQLEKYSEHEWNDWFLYYSLIWIVLKVLLPCHKKFVYIKFMRNLMWTWSSFILEKLANCFQVFLYSILIFLNYLKVTNVSGY